MNKQAAALALSLVLCCGSLMPSPVVAAPSKASPYKSPQAPSLLKTAITQNQTHVELTMGKAHVIKLNMPATRVSISDPESVGLVMLSPTEIQLIGKSIGVANLLVWSEKTGDNYLVIDLSVHRDVSTLAEKIRMIDPGINVMPVAAEDSVILTGVAESIDKAQLAYDLTKAFFQEDGKASAEGSEVSSNSPGSASMFGTSTKIINMIRVIGQPSTKAEMIQERLKDIDPNIVLKVVPGFGGKEKAILSGRVRNASMVSKAVNLASVFYGTPGIKVLTGPGGNVVKEGKDVEGGGGFEAGAGGELIGNLAGNVLHGSIITDTSGNVVSMMEVEERPQVKCTIKFIEVQKNLQKQYGSDVFVAGRDFKFMTNNTTNATSAAGSPSSFFGALTGANSAVMGFSTGRDFAMVLQGLITENKARVLAEPTMSSLSGEPSSFLAGGEFPIPVIGTNGGVSVIFKEFGIRLNVLATVTDRGTVHMQVSPEVSSLDFANAISISGTEIPALRSRRSQSVVELKDGESFVMGGLYNEEMIDAYRKTPILGQIPILGALFSSRDYQRNKTEMIIVVHPEIKHDMDLSNLSATKSQVSQTIKLDPEEVFKELSESQKADAKKKSTLNWDAAKMKPAQLHPEQAQAESVLPMGEVTDPKAAKKAMRELKREQKRLAREARHLEKAKAPSHNLVIPEPMVSASPAMPVQEPGFMQQHQEELSALLQRLEQTESAAPGASLAPISKPQPPLKSLETKPYTQAVKPRALAQ